MGPRGDAIAQFDDSVGRILGALDRLQLATNTLVILSSDNGPVVDDGYRDEAVAKLGTHRPAGPWRGGKYSAYEGGTRVPFLVRWPAQVRPGTSAALVSHVDFPASFAALVGQPLAAEDAPDSFDVLPALLGRTTQGREHLVEQAGSLSLRIGNAKLIAPGRGAAFLAQTRTETGQAPLGQLFDLATDPGETNNLVSSQPERAKEMQERLRRISDADRSRP